VVSTDVAPRFPDDVATVLTAAGWFPGRSVAQDIEPWLADFTARTSAGGQRHQIFPAARAVLDEFGGLLVRPDQHGGAGFPFGFYPAQDWFPDPAVYAELAGEIGSPVFPVGVHGDGPSELAVDGDGRVLLLHWSDDLVEGDDIDAALITLVRGAAARPLVEDGT